MSNPAQDSNLESAEGPVKFLNANGQEALIETTRTLDELRQLYEDDDDSFLSESKVFAKAALTRIYAAHGDDIFMLLSYVFDEEGSELNHWPVSVTDAVFEKILKQCETLTTLALLYKLIPGEAQPGADENYHERVVKKMVKVAMKADALNWRSVVLRKLFVLRRQFFKIPDFRTLIEMKINAISEKK